MPLESKFIGQLPFLSITWSILGSCGSRTKSYYWHSFPFYCMKLSKPNVALLPSFDIYIYTYCIYNSTLTSLLLVPTLYFLWIMKVHVVGEEIQKKGFLDCEFWQTPKIRNSLNPKYILYFHQPHVYSNILKVTSNLSYCIVIVIAGHHWRIGLTGEARPPARVLAVLQKEKILVNE